MYVCLTNKDKDETIDKNKYEKQEQHKTRDERMNTEVETTEKGKDNFFMVG